MAYVTSLFEHNFLEYASYVIKDRAIPDLGDGLKPVQRRILHSLFDMDDGKFHKVANVVGHCMKYHPHGDASIYSALVVLANKELLIDKQGNFGNIATGDEASAARYIECRVLPFAKETLYNPELTEYEPSYDGRNKEPLVFPSKLPYVLLLGAEGIAVGMSTKILPHNLLETIEAMKAAVRGDAFTLYPDFPGGGLLDVSGYEDGQGKVLVRARLDTSDAKRIVIRELPFGSTTESLIASIEAAARKNKIKIASISDFTTENVEIEIKLARGIHTQEVVEALYAFTDCEYAISVNLLVIRDRAPVSLTVTEVIQYQAGRLTEILKRELEIEQGRLRDRLHARTLEQIFIEERIYKDIEEQTTSDAVTQAVFDGLRPFQSQIKRTVTAEDIERLLKIAIRRISLYDINKAKREMREIKDRLAEIKEQLSNLRAYTLAYLDTLGQGFAESFTRKSEITRFDKVDVREAAQRNLSLRYDEANGYLGHGLSGGKVLFEASPYDRVLVIRSGGTYNVIDIPEKLFVGKGMLYCGAADKDALSQLVFSVVYRNKDGSSYLKRCRIEQYILAKSYELVPEGSEILKLTVREDLSVVLNYKPKPQLRVLEEVFRIEDYLVKGVRASGVRLSTKVLKSVKLVTNKTTDAMTSAANTEGAAGGNGNKAAGKNPAPKKRPDKK
jgi:topoisomerase IV subunit A